MVIVRVNVPLTKQNKISFLFPYPAESCCVRGLVLVAFALLSGHPIEVIHVGRVDGVADDAQVVDLCRFFITLE